MEEQEPTKIGDVIPQIIDRKDRLEEKGARLKGLVDSLEPAPRREVDPLLPDYLRGLNPDDIPEKLGIPPLYIGAQIEHFEDGEVCLFSDGTAQPLERLALAGLVEEGAASVLVQGSNGAGKSYFAAALAKRWGCRWVTMIDILLRVRRSFHVVNPAAGDKSELGIVEEYSTTPRLVIDDITAMNATDFGLSTALAILSKRIDNKLPTIVTSFARLDDLERLDSSVASRLGGFLPILVQYNDHPSGDRRLGQ